MRSFRLTALAFAMLALAVPTQDVEAQGAILAFAYDVTVKPGSAPAFEAAWKEQIESTQTRLYQLRRDLSIAVN